MQNTEDDPTETTARKPAAAHDVDRTAQQTWEDAAENDEADRATEVDAADDLIRFGQPALRVVAGRHGQQPHDQPDGRSSHEGPGPESSDECDGKAP